MPRAATSRSRSFADEEAAVGETSTRCGGTNVDRVECLWEAAHDPRRPPARGARHSGPDVAQTMPFRDKQVMKEVLDAAGIRTPRHVRASTIDAVRAGAERDRLPADHQADRRRRLGGHLPRRRTGRARRGAAAAARTCRRCSVEEFIDGEEYTFDTISAGGRILYYNVCWYRPRPLRHEAAGVGQPADRSPCATPTPGARRRASRWAMRVLEAMGFDAGFTHMEWYLQARRRGRSSARSAPRPPGARSADAMNYASDIDVYRGWAEAVVPRPLQPARSTASTTRP